MGRRRGEGGTGTGARVLVVAARGTGQAALRDGTVGGRRKRAGRGQKAGRVRQGEGGTQSHSASCMGECEREKKKKRHQLVRLFRVLHRIY